MKKNKESLNLVSFDKEFIEVGKWFQLTDLLVSDIKNSKFFNIKIEEPEELCIPSEKDFTSVFLYFEEGNSSKIHLIRLHRLLSFSCFKIDKIQKLEDKTYLFSKNIAVELKSALSKNEIQIIDEESINNYDSFLDENLIKSIIKTYKQINIGLTLEEEGLSIFKLHYSSYMNSQKKWGIFNRRQHNGSFYNLKVVADIAAKTN